VEALGATNMNRGNGCRLEGLPSGLNVAQIQLSLQPHDAIECGAES
jgi:hypothetical protein